MQKLITISFGVLISLAGLFIVSAAKAQSDTVTWNYPGVANPPDNIQHHSFSSESMQVEVGYTVYLPPGYASSSQPYPVIYFLHGIQGNEWNYHNSANNPNNLPSLIDSGKIPPTIVVFPNGGRGLNYIDAPGSCDSSKACPETMIITELIPEVDSKFRTIASREGRAIQGFSMGGIGASYYGTKYPNLFSSVAALSSGCWLIDSGTQVQNSINAQAIAVGSNKPAFMLSYGSETGKIVTWQNELYGLLQNQNYKINPVTILTGKGHDLGEQLSAIPDTTTFGLMLGLFHWENFGNSQTPGPTGTPVPTPTSTPVPSDIPTPTPSPTATPTPSGEPGFGSSPRPTRTPRPSPSARPKTSGRTLSAAERTAADLDGNNRVDRNDFAQLRQRFGTESCDHNIVGDCQIDIYDYNALYEVHRGQQ